MEVLEPTKTEEFSEMEAEFFPAHFVCRACQEPDAAFPRAICGAELLGIPAPPEAPVCKTCDDALDPHLLKHLKEMAGE